MEKKRIARRQFLVYSGLATAGTVLAACQPQVVEKIVKETVVVKEEVEKVVKETVVVKEEVQKEVTKVVEKVVEKEVGGHQERASAKRRSSSTLAAPAAPWSRGGVCNPMRFRVGPTRTALQPPSKAA
jgi:anaerobic selenocysteine-containing dehydrogenase